MDQERRNRLEIIRNRLDDILSDVKELLDEEEHYRDNLPEESEESDEYEIADAICDDLSDAMDALDDAVNSILSATTE